MVPKVESHYLRKDSNKMYVSSELNKTRLYSLYTEWANLNNITEIATFRQYRYVLEKEFTNLSFFIPKKDQCSDCEKFKNLNVPRNEGDYKTHLEDVQEARSEKCN